MRQGQKRTSWFMVAHLLWCIGLLVVMLGFAWKYHPIRQAWKAQAARHEVEAKAAPAANGHQPGRFSGSQLGAGLSERLDLFWPLVWPDLAVGSGVYLLFIFGGWVLAKRVEIWLDMHGSGQVAAIRGIGLDKQALGANKGRRGGEL